jgi:hypothetical protein
MGRGKGIDRLPAEGSIIDEEGTAYHEAGHAVVGAVRDRTPIFATIVPDAGGAAGKTEFPKDWRPEYKTHFGGSPEKRAYIETRILTSVAGTIEHDLRFAGRVHDAADAYDERISRELIEDNANDRDRYLERLQETARNLAPLLLDGTAWTRQRSVTKCFPPIRAGACSMRN